MFATIENQISSHKGTCFDEEKPVAFDTIPTSAVTAKWNPVNVVAGGNNMKLKMTGRTFGIERIHYMTKWIVTCTSYVLQLKDFSWMHASTKQK